MLKSHPNYISTAELARFLGISVVAIFKRIKKGQLKAVKIGRSYALPRGYIEEQFPDYPRHKLDSEEFVSVIEAAEILGVHRMTVFEKIKKGQIKALRVGRHYVIEKKQIIQSKETPLQHPALIREHVSVMELADLLNSNRKTIHYQIQTGKIRATRIGRRYVIAREDIPGSGLQSVSQTGPVAEDFISIAQAARTLSVSRIAVFKKIKKGQIKARKIGRSYAILESDFTEYNLRRKSAGDDIKSDE
ncbi:MAG: excisionase family DNA-binding protein [Candidatus Omnitrophota bacterium]